MVYLVIGDLMDYDGFFDGFKREKSGMAFSIDLMLALVVLTVILGVSADAMDIVTSKMEDYSHTTNLERLATNAADILIRTPGSPEYWEKTGSAGIKPGLASLNPQNGEVEPNILSLDKIRGLQTNYDKLMNGNVIPPGFESSLTIYPVDGALDPINVSNSFPDPACKEIVVVNRTVLCDYSNCTILVYVNAKEYIFNPSKEKYGLEKCPHSGIGNDRQHDPVDFHNFKSGWICNSFRISRDILKTNDFYLMTDPPNIGDSTARWVIDRPESMNEAGVIFGNEPIPVNGRISECVGDDNNTVLWLHVFSSGNPEQAFNTYLVGFPKGTSPEKINIQNVNPHPCFFVFKVWV